MRSLTLFFLLYFTFPLTWADTVKPPNVAGQFYTAQALSLANEVKQLVKDAPDASFDDKVRILISPHAGYRFSGSTAAHGFKAAARHNFDTIIILAPTHYYSFDGISVWAEGGMATPLGTLPIDESLAKQFLTSDNIFQFHKDVFHKEHSIEVQLPFIQMLFPEAKIVPMIIGRPDPKVVNSLTDQLNQLIAGQENILVVISADFSHYHNSQQAQTLDGRAVEAIMRFDYEKIWQDTINRTMEIDAFTAVMAGILHAKRKNYQPRFLEYKHSGEVIKDNQRVVGYVSLVFTEGKDKPARPLNTQEKEVLLDIATQTIDHYVKHQKVLEFFPEQYPRLFNVEGSFVTVNKHGHLRGCIGNVLGNGPLYATVRDMAISAVAHDPRFQPVTEQELSDIEAEVSVLSKPWEVEGASDITLGEHGVILKQGDKSGLFLPQVATETGWSKEEFLSQLAHQKLGLSRDAWKDKKTKLMVFTADVFDHHDLQE